MPNLAHEPNLFPEALLQLPAKPESDRFWRVARTKPRQEKAVARHLWEKEVPFYLPLLRKETRIGGRRVCS